VSVPLIIVVLARIIDK